MFNRIYHGGGGSKRTGYYALAGFGAANKVLVSHLDYTPDYLWGKLMLNPTNPGLNKTLFDSGTEQKIYLTALGQSRTSGNDQTQDYLDSKIVVDSTLTKTILNPGANETLQLKVTTPPTKRTFTVQFSKGGSLSPPVIIPPGEGSGLGWATNGNGYAVVVNCQLLYWGVCVGAFQATSALQYTRFNLRKISANGLMTSDLTTSSGSSVASFDLQYGYNDGVTRYFRSGAQIITSSVLSPGEMLFCAVTSQNCTWANSVNIFAVLEHTS